MKKASKKPGAAKRKTAKKFAAQSAQELVETVAKRHGIGKAKPAKPGDAVMLPSERMGVPPTTPDVDQKLAAAEPRPTPPPTDEREAAERFEERTGLKVKRSWAMLDDPKARSTKKGAAEGKPGRGRLNKILGCSACAIAKALGAAGIKWEEADRVMRAHGITMPKPSLSVQLGFGRNRATWEKRGNPAPLSEAQIAELRAAGAKLETPA